MTQTVAAAGRRAPFTFKEIVQLLQDWQVSALPVIEGDGGWSVWSPRPTCCPRRNCGTTRRPATSSRAARSTWRRRAALTAAHLLSSPAVTVRADATLAEAARIMARERVMRLPVADAAGLLAGIVSRADLLKVFMRDDEDIAEEVRREIMSYLPWKACWTFGSTWHTTTTR